MNNVDMTNIARGRNGPRQHCAKGFLMSSMVLEKQEQTALASLGHAISVSRRARGMRQRDLCDDAGIGLNTMVAIEKGVGTVQIGHYIRVLRVLDRLTPILRAAEIGCDELAATEMANKLPKRVGPRKNRR